MKKAILAVFGAVLLLTVSCVSPVNKLDTTGNLRVSLDFGDEGRTIKPTISFSITHYEFIFSSASGQSITRTVYASSTSTPFNLDVDIGQWSLTVNGLNDQSRILVQAKKDLNVKPGPNVLALTLAVIPGKGDLTVRIRWPEGKVLNPVFEAALTKPNQATPTLLTVGVDGTLASLDTSLDSGYYLLTLKLYEGADVAWGYTESVIILAGDTSSLVLSLDAAKIKHAPEAPSNLMVRNYQGTTALLVWTDNSLVESEFELQKKTETTGTWATASTLDFDVSQYKATLPDSKNYYFRVKAKNAWGDSAWSNEIKAVKPTFQFHAADAAVTSTEFWNNDKVHVVQAPQAGASPLTVTAQLTVAPGTIVLFEDGASLVIGSRGTLVARGSSENRIQFGSYSLSPIKGSWGHLWFNNDAKGVLYAADGSYSSGSVLEYVDLSNGTGLDFAAFAHLSHVTVKSFTKGPTQAWSNYSSGGGMVGGGSNTSWLGGTTWIIDDLAVADTTETGLSLSASNGYYYYPTAGGSATADPVFNIKVMNSKFTRAPKASGTFGGNASVTLSNFTGASSLRFESNTIEEGYQGLQLQNCGPGVEIRNNIVRNNTDLGMQLGSPNAGTVAAGAVDGAPLVQGNRIEGNQRGISLQGGFSGGMAGGVVSDLDSYRVFQNSITDNGQMGDLQAGSAKVRFLGNRLTGNRGPLQVSGSKSMEFHSNSFDNKAAWAEVEMPMWGMNAGENLGARYNYWGTTDTETISQRIRDKSDSPDSNIGLVTYQPFFSKPGQFLKAESPASGGLITNYDITFTWSTFALPAKIRFVLSDTADFTTALVDEKVSASKYILTGAKREVLNPEKTYYWKLLPVDSMGVEGEALTFQTFRTPKTGLDIKLGGTLDPELVLSGLNDVVYLNRVVTLELSANRTPEQVKWTLNNALLQTGPEVKYVLNTAALGLGRGAYTLTAEATVDGHPYSIRKEFRIDKIKASTVVGGANMNFVELADGSWWTFGRASDWSDVQQMRPVGVTAGSSGVDGKAYSTLWKDLAWASSRSQFYLFLTKNGDLYSAGWNTEGRLGIGSSQNSWQYTPVLVLSNVKKVESSWSSVLALKTDGTLWAWGANSQGVLGLGNTDTVNTPTEVSLSGVVDMTLNDRRAYAVTDTKAVYGWGSQQNGEFGPTAISNQYLSPKALGILAGAVAVVGRSDWEGTALFLMDDGAVKGMGYTNSGLFANGTQWAQATQPITLPLPPIKTLELSQGTAYAITADADAKLFAWGDNGKGQVGIDSPEGYITTPKLVLTGIKAVSAGPYHVLATDKQNNLYGWGGSEYGGSILPGVTNSRLATQLNW